MIKVPKKPLPSLLTVIGYPFAIALTIFSFFQVGFNIEDFKEIGKIENLLQIRYLTLSGNGQSKMLLKLY